ncbi:actin cortical patch SUR7/pH-response regulator pali [Auriculariales sp. MPI-PUGE-AT-0066]|nr:actin cortical patch SUR7/pH-response regulator pali [Auriculariales sp. MPI-PUGE-AT-0066]
MHFTTIFYVPVPLLAFISWILLLLATVSTPITKSIWIAGVNANVSIGGRFNLAEASTSVRFGAYGYCVSAIHAELAGGLLDHDEPAECSQKKMGYTFDSTVLSRLGIGKLDDDISSTVTFGLSTHLVAAVLSFVALLTSLWALLRMSRAATAATIVFSTLAFIFALIAFAFDIAFASITRRILRTSLGDRFVSVDIGNATWMTLSAMILLLIMSVMSCLGCVRVIRSRRSYDEKDTARY